MRTKLVSFEVVATPKHFDLILGASTLYIKIILNKYMDNFTINNPILILSLKKINSLV